MFPKIKTYTIYTDKVGRLEKPLSFLVYADLHGDTDPGHIYSLLNAADEIKPDCIFTVGDMIMSKTDSDVSEIINFYRDLSFAAPVYAVDGNHELKMKTNILEYGIKYRVYHEMLKSYGIHMMGNRCEQIELAGCKINIYGYELPASKYKKFKRHQIQIEDITEAIGEASNKCFNIMLVHNPAFAKKYFQWGADLVLCGHYHGGLVRVGNQPLASPYGFPLPRFGYGLKEVNDSYIVTSGGLGNHSVPIRIGNPKELVHVIIKNTEEAHGDTGKA